MAKKFRTMLLCVAAFSLFLGFLVLSGCKNLFQNGKTDSSELSQDIVEQMDVVLTKEEATQLAQEKHDIAEDIFNDCTNHNYKYIEVTKVPQGKKFKISDFKLRQPYENENINKHIYVDKTANGEFTVSESTGIYCLENYDDVIDKNFSQTTKDLLTKSKHLLEYSDGKIYVFAADKGCKNGYISSEFVPIKIEIDKIEYIVKSKYSLDDNQKDLSEENIIVCDKKFVLIKSADIWKIDEFSTSQNYYPISAHYDDANWTKSQHQKSQKFANDIINIFVSKDIDSLSKLIKYPNNINGHEVKNEGDFKAIGTDKIFASELAKEVTTATKLFSNINGFMIGHLTNIWFAWFDDTQDFKIITINFPG